MWQGCAHTEEQLRFSLPALPTNRNLLACGPQRSQVLKSDGGRACSLHEEISQLPFASRSTEMHLSSRQMEVSHWQAQISESISRVDMEVFALEMLRSTAEGVLQENQQYSHFLSDCVALSVTVSSANLRLDRIVNQLEKEEQLTSENRCMLEKQICVLLDKMSSLKHIRTQLLADYRDKGDAIKISTKCILYDLNTPCYRIHIDQPNQNHVSHDRWLSHCKNLKQSAENLVQVSSYSRSNLNVSLINLKNNQKHLRCRTEDTLRKAINGLIKMQETLTWERQQVNNQILDLTKDIQSLMVQIRSCNHRLHHITHRLGILNQRPKLELCLDQPHYCLTHEKQDLSEAAKNLLPLLKRSQQDLELSRRHLVIVENKLAKITQALEVEKKLQKLHQSFYPGLNMSVSHIMNSRLRQPRLAPALTHSRVL
ncbi:tektin-2-like [Halichoeres trimaculatus]|uniref:tektin-2-like n=1 Tax=Halichoeres trimaculatus TaxID=147232 RepID=UPI003D9F2517